VATRPLPQSVPNAAIPAVPPVPYRGGAFRPPPALEEEKRLTVPTVLGETVASYLFVFLGTSSIIGLTKAAAPAKPDLLAIALTWGFAVLVIVYAFGHVSGGHINPAVTIGLAVTRKFPWSAVPVYVVAQFAGGILGSLTVLAIFGSDSRDLPLAMGTSVPGAGFGDGTVLLAEVVITFILLTVVMATATDERAESPAVGLGVGLVVAAGIVAMGPVSGASFNPMRSLAPMIVAGHFPTWWAYIIGPVAGGVLGALVFDRLIRPGEPPEPAGAVDEQPKAS
jgi:MIP family channel proteins